MTELDLDQKEALAALPQSVGALTWLLSRPSLTREDIDRAYQAVLEVRAHANLLKGRLQSLIADPE